MLATVFVTQTGTRYHARADLACMDTANGYTEVPIDAAADGGLLPCSTCGAPELPGTTELDRQWLSAISDWARAGTFESVWEQIFARRVLAQTSGIHVDDVEPQALITAAGETYKVDFSIPKAGLVLEVDGYRKDGVPPSPSDLARRNRRDAALQAQGLTVLHFSNMQVQQEPGTCCAAVAQAIAARARPVLAAEVVVAPAPVVMVAARTAHQKGQSGNRGLVIGIGAALAAILVIVGIIITVNAGGSAPSQTPGNTSEPVLAGATDPVSGVCPTGYDVKGNASTKIAHSPGDQFYEKTKPERCFVDIASAEAEGYRAAQR